MIQNSFYYVLVVLVLACSVTLQSPISEKSDEASSLNFNNKNTFASSDDSSSVDSDELAKNIKLYLQNNPESLGDLANYVDDEDADAGYNYMIKKSAPRRIFIGKRYSPFSSQEDELRDNYAAKRNNIHRIFIGKRFGHDIKRIFIG